MKLTYIQFLDPFTGEIKTRQYIRPGFYRMQSFAFGEYKIMAIFHVAWRKPVTDDLTEAKELVKDHLRELKTELGL